MKKKVSMVLLVVAIVIFVSALSFKIYNTKINISSKNEEVDIYEEKLDKVEKDEDKMLEEKIDEEIKSMTLREKIGQMLIITHASKEYTDELDTLLKEVSPAGFILFADNISSYDNTTKYIKKIKEASKTPMLICVDQEGGNVQRIKNVEGVDVTKIPSMYKVGETKDKELSYDIGKVVANELCAFGINTDFAPVLDIYSNPSNTVIGKRAFGNYYKTVIDMALPFANGLKENGIIPVYKHFPGHGDTYADSHFELPVVTKTKEELYQSELLPFKEAIEENAQVIMVAHIALPNVTDSHVPASLSKVIVNDILREELKFDGVVITDAVNMKAITDHYTLEQMLEMAINAGVDIILMPQNPKKAVEIIEGYVNDGKITMERIDKSVKRVLMLKHKNGIYEEKEINKENIGSQMNREIVNKVG